MPKNKHTSNAIFNTYSYFQKNENNLWFIVLLFALQIATLYTFYLISKSNVGKTTGCIPAAVVKLTTYGLIKDIKISEPLFFKISL